ncbi:MAG: cobyric acid synthase [Clostridia bacterium]|nr:cobyric acid synthase [Clostridia bacterium]
MSKKIMFQGTGSSVGKSIIVTAVCRILSNKGINVAPFKSQNMALNSYITSDGDEIGRAQAVQAEASRVRPTVNMNPILLKPTSDVGSQVILNGKVFGNFKAYDYFTLKNDLIPEILRSFKYLEERHDVIVIEGAGSPAEINLRDRDIVNMGLAEIVDTDVILIGDVDKGGVFASLYGTCLLLEPDEQKRIKGFLINKFRGDVELLMPGVKMLEEKIGIPCLGVIPFIKDLNIDDEDSVTERYEKVESGDIRIGVIRLPYLSNLSDFTCFDNEETVSVAYIDRPSDLKNCDLIVIPGSKNTLHDMQFIHDSHLDQAIYKAHRNEVPIIGICGGYQMLGERISDPFEIESGIKSVNGLGIFNVSTVISKEKTTKNSKGIWQANFLGIHLQDPIMKGYEIHMGRTECISQELPVGLLHENGQVDGYTTSEGLVMGTYFHGIFDNDTFRNELINALRKRKGLDEIADRQSFEIQKDKAYDNLVEHVEKFLDWNAIEKILSESRPTP